MALFGRGRARPDASVRRRVEGWARTAGGFGPETAMTVSEIVCADPACPGFETVILILTPGQPTRAVKVAGAMDAIDAAAVTAAITAAPESPGG